MTHPADSKRNGQIDDNLMELNGQKHVMQPK